MVVSPPPSKMKVLVLLVAVLGYFSPTTALLWPAKCTDKYLIETNLLKKNPVDPKSASSVYDFFAKDIDGNVVSMDKFMGKVLMINNAATEWGLTRRNYAQFGVLQKRYAKQGFQVIVFHSNTFNQEPLTNQEIKKWNSKNEGVNFNIFQKIAVNGPCTHPLYQYLKAKKGAIKWNHTKFLINRRGIPVKRYGHMKTPFDAEDDIKVELEKKI